MHKLIIALLCFWCCGHSQNCLTSVKEKQWLWKWWFVVPFSHAYIYTNGSIFNPYSIFLGSCQRVTYYEHVCYRAMQNTLTQMQSNLLSLEIIHAGKIIRNYMYIVSNVPSVLYLITWPISCGYMYVQCSMMCISALTSSVITYHLIYYSQGVWDWEYWWQQH